MTPCRVKTNDEAFGQLTECFVAAGDGMFSGQMNVSIP
jgi:hypothetical protein